VLSTLGVALPTSASGVRARSTLLRLVLRMRGARFTPHADSELDELDLFRLDALWTASTHLADADPPLAELLRLLHGRAALAAGEPSHIRRFLGSSVIS
jgi:hypothetical protein